MSSTINPYSNIVQRNWQLAVLPGKVACRSSGEEAKDEGGKPKKDAQRSDVFDLLREQQVLHSNSFTREFQTRKLMRQFLSTTHSLGSKGPEIMVVSHRFRVDVVSTDSRFIAGFTLARGHSVRLMAPHNMTWHKHLCSSSVTLTEEGGDKS
jgi:hypothetical protein